MDVTEFVTLLPMSVGGKFLLKVTLAHVKTWDEVNAVINRIWELMRRGNQPLAVLVDGSEFDTSGLIGRRSDCVNLMKQIRNIYTVFSPSCVVVTEDEVVVAFVNRVNLCKSLRVYTGTTTLDAMSKLYSLR